MSTSDPQPGGPVTPTDGASTHANPWIWVSVLLALVAVGLLVWGLSTKSDLDSSRDEVAKLEKQVRVGRVASVAAFADLQQQLDTTSADLATSQSDLEASQKSAEEADQAAAAAKEQAAQADNETDKATAEAAQAKAEAQAAESRASIAAECARAFVAGIVVVAENGESSDEGEAAKQDLDSIAGTCKTALAS